MFSHVMIGTNDLDRAKAFYDTLLGTLAWPLPSSTGIVFSTEPVAVCSP